MGGADFGNADDAGTLHGRFHSFDQREDQLVKSNQTEAQGSGARERKPLAHLVEGQQRVGPAVSRSQHVPGAEDGGIQVAFLNHPFAFGAHRDVVLHHHGGRVGDAEVDEMMHAEFGASVDGFAGGDEVNSAKLGGFGAGRVRDTD